MSSTPQKLKERYFKTDDHPYRKLQKTIELYLQPGHVLLDAGCGRSAEVLARFQGKARRLIGIDVVDFEPASQGSKLELLNNDLEAIHLPAASVDIVTSRSVLEHLEHPSYVYSEIRRILKPEGVFIFLTPNLGDYASLASKLIPNRFHPRIVARTEGRKEEDTFPVYYRSNSRRAIAQLARQSNFEIVSFEYLGQYPAYFMFSPFLFLIATGYEKLISRFDSLNFLRGWLLVVLRSRR